MLDQVIGIRNSHSQELVVICSMGSEFLAEALHRNPAMQHIKIAGPKKIIKFKITTI